MSFNVVSRILERKSLSTSSIYNSSSRRKKEQRDDEERLARSIFAARTKRVAPRPYDPILRFSLPANAALAKALAMNNEDDDNRKNMAMST